MPTTVEAESAGYYFQSELTEKYADFSGRARRAEYWWFVLVNFGVYVGLGILTRVLGSVGFAIYLLYALAVIIPSLAVAVRRLHDTSKSGWLFLIVLIPLIGPIILLVFFFTDSYPGPNQYGPSPKYAQQ